MDRVDLEDRVEVPRGASRRGRLHHRPVRGVSDNQTLEMARR
jgi:hypothetical protein